MRSITPAPWQVCCDPTDGPNGSVRVLSSHGGCGVVCVVDGIGDEVVANADLLAAAPELLAALSRLIDAATATYDGQMGEFSDLVRATENACVVLAKAEGRPS